MTNDKFIELQATLVKRLTSLGYDYDEKVDDFALRFCVDKIENKILNAINGEEVPPGLYEVLVDMVCGELLNAKNATISIEAKEKIVKKIVEGENTIEFDTTDISKLYNRLINRLCTDGEKHFSTYRKLVW